MFAYDLDGTLVADNTGVALLPGFLKRLTTDNPDGIVRIVTNQAGPIQRRLGHRTTQPDASDLVARFSTITATLLEHGLRATWYVCVAPTEKAIARFGADTCTATARAIAADLIAAGYPNTFSDTTHRKPAPGMLEAVMADNPGTPLIYIGDLDTDQQAAQAAGTKFMWARDYLKIKIVPAR